MKVKYNWWRYPEHLHLLQNELLRAAGVFREYDDLLDRAPIWRKTLLAACFSTETVYSELDVKHNKQNTEPYPVYLSNLNSALKPKPVIVGDVKRSLC